MLGTESVIFTKNLNNRNSYENYEEKQKIKSLRTLFRQKFKDIKIKTDNVTYKVTKITIPTSMLINDANLEKIRTDVRKLGADLRFEQTGEIFLEFQRMKRYSFLVQGLVLLCISCILFAVVLSEKVHHVLPRTRELYNIYKMIT